MRKSVKTTIFAGTMAIAAIAGLGACGSQVTGQAPPVPSSSAPAKPAAPATSAPAAPVTPAAPVLTGPMDTTFTVSGTDNNGKPTRYGVTATTVLNPAYGSDQYTTPDSGKHFVGVKFIIAGKTGFSSDDANSDAVLIGSNGQVYSADFDNLSAGTNFNDGEFSVNAGQSVNGWVAFQMPNGVSVKSVQWSPDFGNQPATWSL